MNLLHPHSLESNVKAEGFTSPSCDALLYFFLLSPPFSLLLLLFFSFLSPTIPATRLSLPSLSLSFCFSPSSRVASLLHIQLPLCSHPHPSLLLSSFLLPDTGSLSFAQATHGWYCPENNQENQTVTAAVGMPGKPVIQSGLSLRQTEPSLVYIAIGCLL